MKGHKTFYHRVVLESGYGATKETVLVKCVIGASNHTRIHKRNVLPAGFQEPESSVYEERGSSTCTKWLVVSTRVVGIAGQGTSSRSPIGNSKKSASRMLLMGQQPSLDDYRKFWGMRTKVCGADCLEADLMTSS
uniref:Uncharacterized protein n=1 Tax=Timema shepardi TaxID=629360 RepID=A0A7R9B675_TIMSH|nr:unnamed protein product [Timema shepardi]